VTTTALPALLRRGAGAVAAGRVALGLAALARPSLLARPWVGAARSSGVLWAHATSLWGSAR